MPIFPCSDQFENTTQDRGVLFLFLHILNEILKQFKVEIIDYILGR